MPTCVTSTVRSSTPPRPRSSRTSTATSSPSSSTARRRRCSTCPATTRTTPMNDELRQTIRGASLLATLDAELLGDDPDLREHLLSPKALLTEWETAGEQAAAVHLR